MKILTAPPRHGLNAGQFVILQSRDSNKLRRFWHWITFRDPPMIGQKLEIMRVELRGSLRGLER